MSAINEEKEDRLKYINIDRSNEPTRHSIFSENVMFKRKFKSI